MENLLKKIAEIQELIKAAGNVPAIKPPTPPKPIDPIKQITPKQTSSLQNPSVTPINQKNPVNAAQQIQDPNIKKLAVTQAKQMIKTDKNGQWSLHEV